MDITLGIAFLGGLLSFLSPCVLPLVPAYIAYLGGTATQAVSVQIAGGGQVAASPSFTQRLNTLSHGIMFVAGFTFVFVIIGLATTAFLQLVGGANIRLITTILGRVGGIFLIFLGLHVMGAIPALFRRLLGMPSLLGSIVTTLAVTLFGGALLLWAFVDLRFGLPVLAIFALWLILDGAFTQPLRFWTSTINAISNALYADTRTTMNPTQQQGLASSFFMGVVFSAGWTPCIGPIYGSILTLAAAGGSVSVAATQLLAYSLGLGVPFLLAALMMDGARNLLRRFYPYMQTVKIITGVLLIIIGIAVASGRMQDLSRDFAQQFADFSYRLETCTLAIVQDGDPLSSFGLCMNETELTQADAQ
jgi:cytochrome c-type biogenesis protein